MQRVTFRRAPRLAGVRTDDSVATHPVEPAERHAPTELPTQAPDRQGAKMSAWQFRLAVLQHHRAVYALARALLRGDREAEDVTQEAFMRYWQSHDSITRPREWLLKVARNGCLDVLRKRGRLVTGEDGRPEAPDERDPAWHFQQRELAARLNRLVDALPEPQRSLIVLFDMQGLDGASCARVLDLSINQVKVYLHRARRRLRRDLEQSP
jgi:RNA polymerase sigma-70 factor, ECF subfamily